MPVSGASRGGGWNGSSSELAPVEASLGGTSACGESSALPPSGPCLACDAPLRPAFSGKMRDSSGKSSSGSSRGSTLLCSETSPVPPSVESRFSPLSGSSKSDSGPGPASSGSSANCADLRTRLTSSSPLSALSILSAALTSAGTCPRRPDFRTCGTIVVAQHSRTFFTGSAASRTSGQSRMSVKNCGGISRMTESHMRMYAMRLRKDRLTLAKDLMCRTSHVVSGGSR
mmetsp:Transcript_100079/g.278829  ORF Transcript_100079/g.278829 Transcript_100079/m.278829 type:complete len:229 (-) Transcript_100079:211-897(-)